MLIPLPGHTPGTIGAHVTLDRSGAFLLASDTVSLRATLDRGIVPRNTWNADALVKSLAEVKTHRGRAAPPSSAVTTPRNGRACARVPTPMTEPAEIHARPKIIGARVKRTEDPRLLTGLGSYVDDRQVAGVLHVAFRRSDHAHARIRAIDCAAARAAPGVVAVLTAEDLDGLVKPLLATSRMAGYYATPILPLARGKVRYVGEPVVGVVAESRYLAEDALELIAIDFEPLPTIIDPAQAALAGAPLLHEEAGTNVLVAREFKRGDVDAAHWRRRRCGSKAASGCAARPRSRSSRARASLNTSRAATPSRSIPRRRFPASCAMRWRRRSTCRATGCGWLRPTSAAASAARARSTRRRFSFAPRRDSWRDRSNGRATAWRTSTATSQAFDEIVDAELGLDRDGHALALRADAIGDVGAYSIYPWTAALEPVQVVSFLPGPYRIQHYRGRVAGGGDLEGADRPLSRRRAADLDLRHGAVDGHGGGADRHRPRGTSACAIWSAPRNFPTRPPPASSGTVPASANA